MDQQSLHREKDCEAGENCTISTASTIEIKDETSFEGHTYPEGGVRAWLTVAGVFLIQFTTFGYTNAHGVYNDFYVREYLQKTSSSSQIGWIGSTQLFLVMSVGIVSGRAFDAGHFYALMIGGALLFEFCLLMISISQPENFYQVFLSQGVGLGIAIGIVYIPALGVVSHYFHRKRALAIGLATSGSAAGGAIHPIMLNSWFHGSLGFHTGVKASAALTGGLLVIGILLMKPRYPENKKKTASTLHGFRVFLKDTPYVIMIIGTMFALMGMYYPVFFVQLSAIKNGVNTHLAFYTIVLLNGASVIGRILPNLFVYRFGAFNMIIPSVFIMGLLVFCTLGVHDAPGTVIFAILFGFFHGSYVSVLPAMVGSMATDDSEIGARMGVCFTFTGIGGLLGTPISGALLTKSFIWWRPVVFSGICVLIGATCFLTTRCLKARRLHTQLV